jgi:hypothetical protein
MKFVVKSSSFFLMVTLMGLVSQAFLQVKCAEAPSNSDKSEAGSMAEPEKRSTYSNLDEATAVVKTNEYLEQLQQRPFRLTLTPRLFNLILREQMRTNHPAEQNSAEQNSNEQGDEEEDSSEYDDVLVPAKRALSKKESPSEQRNRDLRRQQAARWDIGFGKRAAPSQQGSLKAKSFMDALYGKRSSIQGGKHSGGKASFGRKQQWDIQYGRK